MYKVIRITFIAALLLLATVVETQLAVEAQVAVADGAVEWTTSTGAAADSVKPDSTGIFYINDDALESFGSGTGTWSDLSDQGQLLDVFEVGTGFIGSDTDTVYTLVADNFDASTPANTPITTLTLVAGGFSRGTSLNNTAGTFLVSTDISAAATPTVATFNHHVVDVWAGGDTATRRAKVTSTSDPQGEFVTVSEVTAVGSTTSNAVSKIFLGEIALSSDATKQGTNDDGVWVQDGDTLTVNYLATDGTSLDSDIVTVDGVKPTIGNISPADGTVTNTANPTITFDVTDQGAGIAATPGTVITLAINDNTVDSSKISFQPITDGFRAFFAQGTAWTDSFGVTDSTKFNLAITATDKAGNVSEVSGDAADIIIDQTAPVLNVSKTGAANTAVSVTFSEDLSAGTIDANGSDFTVGGVAATGAVPNADNASIVDLTVTALEPDSKPEIKIVGSLADAAGNAVAADSTVTATDGIKPGITITIDKALAVVEDAVKVTAVTDEKLAVDGLKISVNGAIVATTAPTPQNNEGTFTVAVGDATGTYGAAIQATDGSNVTDNLTAVTDEEIAVAIDATVITLANGPIADMDFDGDVDKADITALLGGSVTSTDAIASIDPSARTITLNAGLVAAATIKVSYHYVATDTFQIDQAAPTVAFEPAQGDKVRNQSPFIRVIFDEDEYPGDTYTTVELTKAEVTNPDGTTEDIAAKFLTADNKEFIWAAASLALGKYTLVVSGKDTAGNEIKDASVEFTIEKRTVTVSLRPGWNLVSIPDSPEDNSINTVITSTDVDVVLTYDPMTPQKWLNATRGTDGLLSGTLSTIDANRAYWVHTGAFGSIVTNIGGLAAGQPGLPPSYELPAGWNLVPVSTPDIDLTERDADDYLSGISWSRAYGYNNATNAFEGILPSTTAVVKIGQGYWVFLKAAGTLVP